MITLSVVIPAYNEEKGIAEILQRVLATEQPLAKTGIDLCELIVVDDGSHDRTGEIICDIGRRHRQVQLIRHIKNKGYGAALKTGFSHSHGDLVGFLDADGTYPPEYFPQLCQALRAGSDLVIGSRMSGEASQMPLTRRVGNFFFANLLTLVGGQPVSDSASGMRVFRRAVLEHLYPLPDGLNLTPVMSTRAIHEKIPMAEVPIPYSERLGRSKLSVVRDGYIFLSSMLWTVMTYNPVRVLGIVGMALTALAGLVLLGLVVTRLMGRTVIGPWGVAALYAALNAAVAGISLFALGATFNYLVSLFYKRPIRQGLFGKPLFNPSIDHAFGWIGTASLGLGLVISLVSLLLGLKGWQIERLWLYLLGSAMFILVGIQLILYWVLMRVLDDLTRREGLVEKDLAASPAVVVPTHEQLENLPLK
jgi:glycosyltransferase involved in cell wall biosynthesis